MMRRSILLVLLAALMLLSSCSAHDPIAPMAADLPEEAVPAADPAIALPREKEVTLWFRFGSEPLLAPERRTLALSPTAPLELTLLQALTGGPAASSTELTGLFPPGTRVLAATRQGRTLFVTLSRQIMNDFADEPDGWASLPDWADEVPLRRRLAMQAIAATVTENCDVDQVVILVEQGQQVMDSLRLMKKYYRDGRAASEPAAPLTRDESVLLTPHRTLDIVLSCWQMRDWPRLYRYTLRQDAVSGEIRPAYNNFAARMDGLPHLTSYAVLSGGSVSPDGQSAVFALEATLLTDGTPETVRWSFRLHRERDIWRVGMSQFAEREVVP